MPRSARVVLAVMLAALLLPTACLPIREQPAVVDSGSNDEPRLTSLLPLDASGETVLRGTLSGFTEVTSDPMWHGDVTVSWPAYVDGMLAEVSVQATVDTATAVPGGAADTVGERLLDLTGSRTPVAVAVRREEGDRLRVSRVSAPAALPAEPPSVNDALRLPAGGRASFSGFAAVAGAGAARGTLRMDIVRTVYRIRVALRIPVVWDASTTLVRQSGSGEPLPGALRATPDLLSRTPAEVRYRRSPDGLRAETVTLLRP